MDFKPKSLKRTSGAALVSVNARGRTRGGGKGTRTKGTNRYLSHPRRESFLQAPLRQSVGL
jgi:hypothetical protein